MVLGLCRGYSTKKHSVPATLLRQYQSHWQQHDGLLYYLMQLYLLDARGTRMELLRCHHDNPIAGHFSAKRTLKLVAMKYNWPGRAHEVKAYTWACLTCQRMHPGQHRRHGSIETLPQPHG
jgi:hypothetical protein